MSRFIDNDKCVMRPAASCAVAKEMKDR
jgi:hypothetical protein